VRIIPVSPESAPDTSGGYVNALQVDGVARLLFISGQIPEDRDGHVPDDIEEQCRFVWANVTAALHAAGMDVRNLVKVTTFLSDRRYSAVNTAVRQQVLGDHQPALTVIITGIFDSKWLLEVEAIAAA
jgi:enamine deaminase RidA (YjgF/YER057c/UK114 family)